MKALVTGASRGIGRAVARQLAARGAQLALVARHTESLTELVAQLEGSCAFSCELSRVEEVETLVDRAVDSLGGLDVVVSCAGIVHYAAVGNVTAASLTEQLNVNLVAPFLIAQRAAMHMRRTGAHGAIVNVASTLGLRPAENTSAYSASKAGLIAMTRAFALELGPYGIRVNAVAPGVIDTDMVRVTRPARTGAVPIGVAGTEGVTEELEALRKLHPLGRLGSVDDVAQAVLYLLDASFVTGSVFTVDGGLLASG